MNTAWTPGQTRAKVDAWWSEEEGGGGRGGGPGAIHRVAIADAEAKAAESNLYVRVEPDPAAIGGEACATAFAKQVGTGEEFGVPADWEVESPAHINGAYRNVSSVMIEDDESGGVEVKAVNNGPPLREGTAEATFVKVASVTCGSVVSTTSEPGSNETIRVWTGGEEEFLVLTAAPEPGDEWPAGSPTWTEGAPQRSLAFESTL